MRATFDTVQTFNKMLASAARAKKISTRLLTDVPMVSVYDYVTKRDGSWYAASVHDAEKAFKSIKKTEHSITAETEKNNLKIESVIEIAPEFTSKGVERTINGYVHSVHNKASVSIVGGKQVAYLKCKGATIAVWNRDADKVITPEFQNAVANAEMKGQLILTVPNVESTMTVDYIKDRMVRRGSVSLGEYKLTALKTKAEFSMDAVGARVRQTTTARLTKSAPKQLTIRPPFCVAIIRRKQVVFAAQFGKDSMVKGK